MFLLILIVSFDLYKGKWINCLNYSFLIFIHSYYVRPSINGPWDIDCCWHAHIMLHWELLHTFMLCGTWLEWRNRDRARYKSKVRIQNSRLRENSYIILLLIRNNSFKCFQFNFWNWRKFACLSHVCICRVK